MRSFDLRALSSLLSGQENLKPLVIDERISDYSFY
jgi:hypothetical protein